jgi:hypothetical protein
MGIQHVRDVTLIRHAYVLPVHQGRGIGGRCTFLAEQTTGPLLVGTWAAADWAIRFYERHGFRLVPLQRNASTIECALPMVRSSLNFFRLMGFMGESVEIPQRRRRDRFSHL